MMLTKDFLKAFNALFAISIVLMGITFWMDATNNLGYSLSEANSDTRILLNRGLQIFMTFAFWGAIAYATKEYKGVAIVLILKTAISGYFTYSYLSNGFTTDTRASLFWFLLISSMVAYLLFGLIHFKDKRGLYILLVFFLVRGISIGANSAGYNEFVNGILKIFRLEDLFEMRISLSDTSYRPVNLFRIITSRVFLPLNLLIFWWVYSKIKNGRKMDFSLRTIYLNTGISKLSYSTIYWTLKLTLITVAFGVLNYLQYAFTRVGAIETIINLFLYGAAIYVVASMYRNFLTAWFVSKGKYPGWLYFFLNIPFFNFFAWLASLFNSADIRELPVNKKEVFEVLEKQKPLSRLEQIQKQFRNGNKNQAIKVLIMIFVFLGAIIQLANVLQNNNSSLAASGLAFFSLIVTIVFTVWYFTDSKAVYIQTGLIALGLLGVGASQLEAGIGPGTIFGMINIIFYYSLFHFDQLKFLEEEGDDSTENLDENQIINTT